MTNISKNEISWWKGIIVVIVAVVIWGVRLESNVNAMGNKSVTLKKETEEYMKEIKDDLRIIKNIQIDIAKVLNITIQY